MVMMVLGEGHTCYYGDDGVWTEFIPFIEAWKFVTVSENPLQVTCTTPERAMKLEVFVQ